MNNTTLQERLDAALNSLAEAELRIADPAVMADMRRYVELTREHSRLQRIASAGESYRRALAAEAEAREMLESPGSVDDDPDMLAMAREQLAESRADAERLEHELRLMLVPADPADAKDAILEIRAGTGGDEAALFAGSLFRMYSRYCARRGWQLAVTSVSEGAVGGYKEIVATVSAPEGGVYGRLKYEGGVHRVQRVPATETQGRVHTSAATVAVLPEADTFEVEVDESAIKWDTFRSSGAGGQNVNKVESGVRLRYPFTDPETGATEEILIECTETRDQPRNKERALARLRAMLLDRETRRRSSSEAEMRRSLVSTGDRSAKIRTYNFPQGRVTDHRINFTSHDLPGILDGNLDPLVDALTLWEDN